MKCPVLKEMYGEMKTILTTIIVGLLIVYAVGLNLQMDDLEQQADVIYAEGYSDGLLVLPSIEDIQRRVGAKVDGKVSPDWRNSETQTKWEAEYCQQAANVQLNNKTMGIKE